MTDLIYRLLAELNEPQRVAVSHSDGPLLVLAGAGSGKTRVLAYRAAFLVHQGITAAQNILALTFTNKAAGELRTRTEAMVGDMGGMVTAGTFHSFFAKLMRREGFNIGIDPQFTIIDSDDKRRLIKAILTELNISPNQANPASVDWAIGNAKNSLITPDEYRANVVLPFHKIVAEVYWRYEKRLKQMNGMDFDDLLIRPLEAFNRHRDFLERVQARYRYVMVDEFQDTNIVQNRLVTAIASSHRNLCVVGDDDQSIYGWRGASVSNILEFKRDWPDARVVHLEQNYRSTRPILEAAWSVINRNKRRHPKKLWTERTFGEAIDFVRAYDGEDEARQFVTSIQQLHRLKSVPYSEFAILYRTNDQSLPFERTLRATEIPYYIVGGLRFYERKEVKDVIAYLRYIVNPTDDISLLRIINYPPRGIGDSSIQEMQARARLNDQPVHFALMDMVSDNNLSSRQQGALIKFTTFIDEMREVYKSRELPDFMAILLEKLGLEKRLKEEEKRDPTRAESKWGNIENLLMEIERFYQDHPDGGLTEFLEQVALITDAEQVDQSRDRVNLMTLHSAKGLEFSVVLIGGVEDGLIPLIQQNSVETDIEEERRLLYVGITRAKDKLILGTAQYRARWGFNQITEPSRFLADIPSHLFGPAVGRKPFQSGGSMASRTHGSDFGVDGGNFIKADQIRAGQLVKHPKFGLGLVVAVKGSRADTMVTVDFDDVGMKNLILRLARLEAVK